MVNDIKNLQNSQQSLQVVKGTFFSWRKHNQTCPKMKDYVKPCLQENNPDHVVLHVGINDLVSKNITKRIKKHVVDLPKNSVKDLCSVSISSVIPRND